MNQQLPPGDAERLLGTIEGVRARLTTSALLIVDPMRQAVLWSNRRAAQAFGIYDRGELEARLFRPGRPGSTGLQTRLARLQPGEPPSLERLMPADPLRFEPMVFSAASLGSEEGYSLVVLIGADHDRSDDDLSYVSALSDGMHAGSEPREAANDASEAVAERSGVNIRRNGLKPRHSVRLLWEASQDGTITRCDPQFAAMLGTAALKVGDNLITRLSAFDSAAGADVAAALAECSSRSGMRVAWPLPGLPAAVPTDVGFICRPAHTVIVRGFCVFDLADVDVSVAAPAAAEPVVDDDLQNSQVETSRDEAALNPPRPSAGEDDGADDPTAEGRQDGTGPAAEAARTTAPDVPSSDNIVHFRSFKGATIHAAFSQSLTTTKPAWLKTPDTAPIPPPSDEEPLDSPVWAEAPDTGTPSNVLSPDEWTAFDEIGRALGGQALGDRAVNLGEVPDDPSIVGPVDRHASVTGSFGPDVDISSAGTMTGEPDEMGAADVAVLDALPLGIAVRRDGRLIFMNRTLLNWLGLGSVADAAARRDGADQQAAMDPFPGFGPEAIDVSLGTPGATIRVEASTRPITWNHADAMMTTLIPVASAMDKMAVASPIGWGEMEAALAVAADGVAFLDGAGRILSLNATAEHFFGVPGAALAGESATALYMSDQAEAWSHLLQSLPAEDTGYPVLGSLQGRTVSGAVPLHVQLARIAPDVLCCIVRDETEQLRGEEELKAARRQSERANTLKSEFLAKVSHEVRTPLNAILGFAEVMMEERLGPVGTPRYVEYLRDIHASGTHVLSLVNDLLDLSRIEAGRLDLDLKPVPVNALVSECVATLQPQAHRERVIVRSSLAPHLPAAQADERSFRQIVLNLLSNAVKFNEPGGQVIVSTALTEAGRVAVRVRDTGIGMSEDDITVAMEPFRQLATAKSGSGTGLGLPLTKALVEASGADMSIKSRVGDGTLVEVVFPAADANPISIPAE